MTRSLATHRTRERQARLAHYFPATARRADEMLSKKLFSISERGGKSKAEAVSTPSQMAPMGSVTVGAI